MIDMPKPKVDHTNTICCICRGNTCTKGIDFDGKPMYRWFKYKKDIYPPRRYVGNYICNKCRMRYYNRLPDSYHYADKSVKDIRTGNLDKNSPTGKAIIDQAVVCKVLKIEDLNLKNNNFGWFIDTENEEYGKIDIKGPSLSIYKKEKFKYYYWHIKTKRKIDCDTYILLGHTLDRKDIESAWAIPNNGNICSSTNIKIWQTNRNILKWEKFRIDEKPYNDAYHSLNEFLKDKKYFGIEDIKKWLELSKVDI